jgi:hypothetical protein
MPLDDGFHLLLEAIVRPLYLMKRVRNMVVPQKRRLVPIARCSMTDTVGILSYFFHVRD